MIEANSAKVVVPKMKWLETGEDVTDFSSLSRSSLLKDWSLAHLCYGVFPRALVRRTFEPIFSACGPEFDWVLSMVILEMIDVVPGEMIYLKRANRIPYDGSYYTGDTALRGRTRGKVVNAIWHHFGQIIELRRTLRVVCQVTQTKRLTWYEVIKMVWFRAAAKFSSLIKI